MRHLSLFAGAGGSDLAAMLLGWATVCRVERNRHRANVLEQRVAEGFLDDAPCWSNVHTFDGRPWRGRVDVVTAGFPCQPFSVAGKQKAADDPRNGWPSTHRILREVRPRWVLLENPTGLAGSHGYLGRVLGDLASLGYDALWDCVSARALGAPHSRDRIWIVARARLASDNDKERTMARRKTSRPRQGADTHEEGCQLVSSRDRPTEPLEEQPGADADGLYRARTSPRNCANPHRQRQQELRQRIAEEATHATTEFGRWWCTEPSVGRVVDGLANRVDRIAALGNGQVPIVAVRAWTLLAPRLIEAQQRLGLIPSA